MSSLKDAHGRELQQRDKEIKSLSNLNTSLKDQVSKTELEISQMSEKLNNSKSRSRIFNEDGSINDANLADIELDPTDDIMIKRMKKLEEEKEMSEKEKQMIKE